MYLLATVNDPLEKLPLAHLSAKINLAFFLIILIGAYLIAFLNRNHYQTQRLCKQYAVFAAILFCLSLACGMQWLLSCGSLLFGFFVLLFRSNAYFYQQNEKNK